MHDFYLVKVGYFYMDSSTSEDEKSRYKQPPPAASEIPSGDESEVSFVQRKRKASIYDAVAGKVG